MKALLTLILLLIAFLTAPCFASEDSLEMSSGKLRVGVIAIPDDGSVAIANLTPTSVTLTGQVPNIKPGSIIAGGPAPGIMRHVLSVRRAGDTIVMQTSDAALTDVFESAHVRYRGPIELTPIWRYGDPPLEPNNGREQ